MLVRFQLPQLRTEVIRPDEDTVLKTVGRAGDLWVRVPRLPPRWAHGPTGRHKLRTLEIWVRFPVSPLRQSRGPTATTPVLQTGNDGSTPSGTITNAQVRQLAERLGLNPRDSRFDSSSGHMRLGRQLADHLGLEPGMLWVRIPPELLNKTSSSWSSLECSPACHAGDRGFKSHRGRSIARYANRKSGEAQTFVTLWVRLPPVLLIGSCSSWLPVKQSSQNKRGGRREVQFLHDPLTDGPFV